MADLTDKQYLELTKLSYLYEGAFTQGQSATQTSNPTLGALAEALLKSQSDKEPIPLVPPGKLHNGYMGDEDLRETLAYIQNGPVLSGLVLLEYLNDNADTGFVGLALRDGDDNRYFAFTGSEGRMYPVPEKDWIDNFFYGLTGDSAQFDIALEFTKRHMKPGKKHYFTAHSKGGLNVSHTIVQLRDYDVVGVTFNAPGQNRVLYLNASDEQFLLENVTNYVTYRDYVGNLFPYPENTIIVDMFDDYKMVGKNNSEHGWFERFFRGHFPQGFKLDDQESVIPYQNRDPKTIFADIFSRTYVDALSLVNFRAWMLLVDSYIEQAKKLISDERIRAEMIQAFTAAAYESFQKQLERLYHSSVETVSDGLELERMRQEAERDFHAAAYQAAREGLKQLADLTAASADEGREYLRVSQAIERDFYLSVSQSIRGALSQFYDFTAAEAKKTTDILPAFQDFLVSSLKDFKQFYDFAAAKAKNYLDPVIDEMKEWNLTPALTPAPDAAPRPTPEPTPKASATPNATRPPSATPKITPPPSVTPAPNSTLTPLETLDTDPFADIAAANFDPSDPEDFAELAKRFNHGMSLSVVKALIELDAEILDNPIKIEEKMDVPATYDTPAHRIRRTTYVNPADRSVTSTPWTVM